MGGLHHKIPCLVVGSLLGPFKQPHPPQWKHLTIERQQHHLELRQSCHTTTQSILHRWPQLAVYTKPHHRTMKPPTCQSVKPFFGFFLHLRQTARAVSRWACNDPEHLLSVVHRSVLNGRCQAIGQRYKHSCSLIFMASNILPATLPCPLEIYEMKKAFFRL
jgi:hypothetical protein